MRAAFYCIADARYFPGAVGLVSSLRLLGHNEPIYVLDAGLTNPQREVLEPEVTLVAGPRDAAPTLLKTIAPLRHPAEVMVLIDTDMIVTRPLTPLIEHAVAGHIVAFENERDRFVPEWGELLGLGTARRGHHYVSAGLVFVGGAVGGQVLRLLDQLQARIDFELTCWGRSVRDYPFLYADQDILNAILATRLDRDQLVVLEKRLAPFPPFDGLRLLDERALRCRYPDGSEPYVLHHFLGKPWLEPTPRNVYSRLLTRLLFAPDAPLPLDRAELPMRLRPGWADSEGASLEIVAVSQAPPSPKLAGHVDMPVAGARTDPRWLGITGWALGEHSAAVAIELEASGEVLWRVGVDRERPDVAQAFPGRPEAGRAGFEAAISVLATAPQFELGIRAVLADGTRARIGTIRCRHRWHGSPRYAELVSVVIPCFNQAHFLGEAIESVLSQSYPNIEVVVIDDGSRDNTGEVARRYPGVRYLRQPNAGVAVARNSGIRETAGEFLIFLDADDRLLEHAVEIGAKCLRGHPECGFVTGSCRFISQEGRALHVLRPPHPGDDPFAGLLQTNWTGEPARSIYRRQAVEEVGGFDGSLSPAEDYDLNLRIAHEYQVRRHDDVVAERREHAAGASVNSAVMLAQVLRVARRHRAAVRRRGKREAYSASVSFWRSYYGEPLIREVRRAAREGRGWSAANGLAALLRYHPRGLARVIRSPKLLRDAVSGLRSGTIRVLPSAQSSNRLRDQTTARPSSEPIDSVKGQLELAETQDKQRHREASWARVARQIERSRSWRVGSFLSRTFRVLTFRRPASPHGPAELAASIEDHIDSVMAQLELAETQDKQRHREASWARVARQIERSRSWRVGSFLSRVFRLLTFQRAASPHGPAELAASIEEHIDLVE